MPKTHPLTVAGILLFAVLLRFYKLREWLIYGMDQEYQSLISRNIVSGNHFPLIGVNASDTGLYLGPWFSYAAAAIHAVSAGNPLGGAVVSSLTGLLVVFLIYILGRRLIGENAALFAALIYSGSFLVAFYDRQFWNPTPVPLVSLLLGYFLVRLHEGRIRLLPWLFLLLGLSFSIHLSLLIFFPLGGYVLWNIRKKISRRLLYVSLGIFFFMVMPQLLFEVRHDFGQVRALMLLLSGVKPTGDSASVLSGITVLFNALGRLLWLPGAIDWLTLSGQCRELSHVRLSFLPGSILMSIICLAIFFRKQTPLVMRYLLVASAIFVLVYPRPVFEYYFLFLFPWIALIAGMHLEWIWRQKRWGKGVVITGITVFVILNAWSFSGSSYSYSYRDKMNVLTFAREFVADREYGLEAFGECPRFGGWRYLFEHHIARPPAQSYMDSYFSWLYPRKEVETVPERIVVLSMIDDRMENEIIMQWEEREREFLLPFTKIAESEFGRIRVYILEK